MRLKSEIWVKAYLRRCTVNGASGVVARHGDDDAGAIFIKIMRADLMAAVFSRRRPGSTMPISTGAGSRVSTPALLPRPKPRRC